MSRIILSGKAAQALDREASASWGLDPFALVEAAGRSCAAVLVQACPEWFSGIVPRIQVVAGSGNNGADAMVLLRALILAGRVKPEAAALLINRLPAEGERTPRSEAFRSLKALGVPVSVPEALTGADIIIDGIAGTGLQGPLRAGLAEMAAVIGGAKQGERPLVVSIDVPSGNFDDWKPGMPILKADYTLAIEPFKQCLYSPPARPFAGTILPVGEIFPPALMAAFGGAELVSWEDARTRLPPIPADAYKRTRGSVEIRAGSPLYPGAPRLAARGAQAAGAGLVRLIVDDEIYPILAVSAGGIIVSPQSKTGQSDRFRPDAMLLGPGWGRGENRLPAFRNALDRERDGCSLILDADAIHLAKDTVFHGNAIITPHVGELAAYAGLPKEEIIGSPGPFLTRLARERNVTILFKSHVMFVAGTDGRLGVVDGMTPILGAGGTGDLLGGLCAAIAARQRYAGSFDPYTCALIAAALLAEVGRIAQSANTFTDPMDLADIAAGLAGKAWL